MTYRIREVDGSDHVDILAELHGVCFGKTAAQADYDQGFWWIAFLDKEPVAFAGLTPSILGFNAGYLKRSGVLPEHQGHGLQKRLIRARESKARKLGWSRLITDTTDNPPSANSLYRAGFKMFAPKHGWAFDHSLYWQKTL